MLALNTRPFTNSCVSLASPLWCLPLAPGSGPLTPLTVLTATPEAAAASSKESMRSGFRSASNPLVEVVLFPTAPSTALSDPALFGSATLGLFSVLFCLSDQISWSLFFLDRFSP